MLATYYETEKRNYYNGETIFTVTPKEKNDFSQNGLIKCKGIIPVYEAGTPLVITGNYIDGLFEINSCKLCPEDRVHAELILRHINDKISDVQIERILEISNNNLFDFVVRFDAKEQLLKVFNKTKSPQKYADNIFDGITRLKDNELFTVMFSKYHMPLDAVESLIKNKISYSEYKKRPYLYGTQYRIPIKETDEFAFNECNIDEYSVARLCGYVYECMTKAVSRGNACLSFTSLLNKTNHLLSTQSHMATQVGAGIIAMCVKNLYKYMCCVSIKGTPYIYLNHVKKEEDAIIMGLERLMRNRKGIDVKKSVEEVETKLGIHYNEGQKKAFNLLKSSGIKILTGPPGSGKTAVIDGLLQATSIKNIALSATTGMAAKVMSDACKRNAQTVHQMIEYIPFGDTERCKDLNDPIDAELIIVDEVSMLGVNLCSLLLNAIKNESIVLLVGDEDQLESVEYGNILHDLISSGLVEVYRLTEIMRQSGTICENAFNVKNGISILKNDESFKVYECQNEDTAKNILLNEYSPKGSQIITPTKKGMMGSASIHEMLVNKSKKIILSYGRKDFRVGDKIVMTANNYNHGYINGDIGYVIGEGSNGSLEVDFMTKKLEISHSDLYDVDFADAVTIHKSQGSEYETVHIVLPKYAEFMISRRMLYTAITRAKKKVYIYSVQNTVDAAISNIHEYVRCTALLDRMDFSANLAT